MIGMTRKAGRGLWKKLILFAAVLLAAVGFASAAGAEEPPFVVDMPPNAVMGVEERMTIDVWQPEELTDRMITMTCSDPDAVYPLIISPVRATETHLCLHVIFSIIRKGQYTLTFSDGSGYHYDVNIRVEDLGAYTVSADTFTVSVGGTVPIGFALTGGVRYGELSVGEYDRDLISFSEDLSEITGLMPGTTTVYYYSGLTTMGSFTVTVISASESVSLSAPYDRSAVGYQLPLTVRDGNGNEVIARVAVTEGQRYGEVRVSPDAQAYLYAFSPGEVTITAWGTDGSSDSLRIRIYEMATADKAQVNLSSRTLAAGESLPISVSFAEGTWAPVEYSFYNEMPYEQGLNGSVAVVENERLLGLIPGSGILSVHAGAFFEEIPVTVMPGERAYTIVRPAGGFFDWHEPFRMAVLDGAGNALPAVFKPVRGEVNITRDGILTAEKAEGSARVNVSLPNGARWEFSVHSKDTPARLETDASILLLPLDMTWEMTGIRADVRIEPVYDVILCSSDESVLKIDGLNLLPQRTGSAVVTVWSRYNDVCCHCLVQVTEPTDRLYANGTPDSASMDLAGGDTVPLPSVTDYWGNAVPVTWSVAYESHESGNPNSHIVSLINNTHLRGLWGSGEAQLLAVSASGSTLQLNVHCYRRAKSEDFRFDSEEYTLMVGGYCQAQLLGDTMNGIFSDGDIAFRLSGNTDCVRGSAQVYAYDMTAVKEGNAVLTAVFRDGRQLSAKIRVITNPRCASGHDPVWYTMIPAGAFYSGTRVKICSRCGLTWGEEAIPCTGKLCFAQTDYIVRLSDTEDPAALGTTLDGDYKQSFTWRSSDPSVAEIVADRIIPLKTGTATVTVYKGECVPAVCRVHVIPDGSALILPSGLRSVEESAFEGVSAAYICLPEGTQSIGKRAFADCASLQMIVIPDTVAQIAEDALDGSAQVCIRCSEGSVAASFAAAHGIRTDFAGETE